MKKFLLCGLVALAVLVLAPPMSAEAEPESQWVETVTFLMTPTGLIPIYVITIADEATETPQAAWWKLWKRSGTMSKTIGPHA